MHNHIHIEQELALVSKELYEVLDHLLPHAEGNREDQLLSAMRYASLSNGKRVRPFLTVHAAALFGVDRQKALQTAAAIEMVHSYSIVHDDLPALDNDDQRRGILSCHKKFDEATAILAGDALLTYAFELLTDMETHPDPLVRIELVRATARASGFRGMVGGQMMDLLSEHQSLSIVEIIRLQRLKTGELFLLSCEAGAILGKASLHLRKALLGYASNIGLAFQITDDLLDFQGTREETGKTIGKDAKVGKASLVTAWGAQKCHEHVEALAQQAVEYLVPFGEQAATLRDVAVFLIKRNR